MNRTARTTVAYLFLLAMAFGCASKTPTPQVGKREFSAKAQPVASGTAANIRTGTPSAPPVLAPGGTAYVRVRKAQNMGQSDPTFSFGDAVTLVKLKANPNYPHSVYAWDWLVKRGAKTATLAYCSLTANPAEIAFLRARSLVPDSLLCPCADKDGMMTWSGVGEVHYITENGNMYGTLAVKGCAVMLPDDYDSSLDDLLNSYHIRPLYDAHTGRVVKGHNFAPGCIYICVSGGRRPVYKRIDPKQIR